VAARRAAPVPVAPAAALRALERVARTFGGDAARTKLALLRRLARAALARPREVYRLHEALCFLAAYPDDARVHGAVRRMLDRFARRADLKRHAEALADTGIAGTPIEFAFFAPTALWLVRRDPRRMTIRWREFARAGRLEELLHLLATWSESPGLDEYDLGLRGWIERMKSSRETDAAFVVKRLAEALPDPATHEALYDALDPPMRLAADPKAFSRTTARAPVRAIHYRSGPLERTRPDFAREVARPPLAVRELSPREGRRYIELAREAMVTRSRDLDAFSWADPRDVRLIEFDQGLAFACLGMVPERRLLFESVYGFLTLRNGVPTGYVLTSALYRSCEVAYNVFETYRGADAARTYVRAVAMARHLFGADSFTIYPYQLGDGNDEAIESGAWWFYHKLGYRPRDAAARRIVRAELARMRRDPAHRSSHAVLRKLATANLYFHLGERRDDVIGRLPLANAGVAVTNLFARRFGSDRRRGERECAAEAAALLGVRSMRGWSAGERLGFERWSPVALLLPGVRGWSPADRRALVEVMRAKGGRRESDFVRRFDAHPKLGAALRRLAEKSAP
jgi:hypothetical protein